MVATLVNQMILDALGVGCQDEMYGALNSFFEKSIALITVLFLILITLRPASRRMLGIRVQPLARVIGLGLAGALVLNVVVVVWQKVAGDDGGSQLKAFGAGEGAWSDVFLVLAGTRAAMPGHSPARAPRRS